MKAARCRKRFRRFAAAPGLVLAAPRAYVGGMIRLAFISVLARLTLVLALGTALAAAGPAHRGMDPADDGGLAAYLAAGGSLSDICGDVDGHGAVDCPACHLVKAMDLPPVVATAKPFGVALPLTVADRGLGLPPVSPFALRPPGRAPPVV